MLFLFSICSFPFGGFIESLIYSTYAYTTSVPKKEVLKTKIYIDVNARKNAKKRTWDRLSV